MANTPSKNSIVKAMHAVESGDISMQKLIHAALYTPQYAGPKFTGKWGMVLCFVGGPGEGKSTLISDVCSQSKMLSELLALGERGEGAVGAVPVPQDGFLTYPMPDWTVKFEKLTEDGNIDPNGEAGVVFMDELNTLPLHVQASALGLSLDGRIGGGQLPNRVRRLAAMNETEDAAGGWDLAPALLNRFCWVPWVAPDAQEFGAFWMGGAKPFKVVTDAAQEEARVLAAWPAAWAGAVGAVTAFVKHDTNMLKTTPKAGERAFATRRSIGQAMHALATSQVHGLNEDERRTLVAGCVGSAWYDAFCAYMDELSLPDAASVLDGTVAWKHDASRLDVSWALFGSMSSLVITESDATVRNNRANKLWSLLRECIDTGTNDVGLDAASALAANRHVPCTTKDAISVCAKLQQFEEKLKGTK
jgi:hypothetical protein